MIKERVGGWLALSRRRVGFLIRKGGTLRHTARCVVFGLVLLLLSPCLFGQQVSLTILHTNDTHGHLLPFSYPSIVPPDSELAALKVRQNIGGIARRATLVKRLRAELEAHGTPVWLVDAGDFCDGTSFSTEYHGEADVAAMNATGYTFGTLGNHEFNNPLSRLKSFLSQFTFPILCANALDKASGKPLTQESAIRELGPLKVGVFGLTAREGGNYQAGKEGVIVGEEIGAARRLVQSLRSEAGIIIAISHAGERLDGQLGEAVPGIDVIIGGHSHSRMPLGQLVWHSDELKADDVNGTVIVQAHQWAGEIGRLDLLFHKDDRGSWHVERYRARLIPVTPDIPDDETVAAVVDRYWKPIAARYGEIIGQAADDIAERGADLAPYNLVADVIRETYGADIALENIGGVRAPLIKGNITREDLVNMDPFANTVVTFNISGRKLKEILQKARPAVSGIRYRMEKGALGEATVGGQPIDDDRIYTGVTNSFLAERYLKGMETKNTGRVRLDVVIEYIRKKGTIKPSYDGRRVVIAP